MIDLTLITKFSLAKYVFMSTIFYGVARIIRLLIKGE